MQFTQLSQLSPPKILLVTAERVGDAIFCTPAIRLLKRHLPQMTLDILAFSSAAADIFANNPDIHRIHISANNKAIRDIAADYPLVINLTYEFLKYLDNLPTQLISIGPPDRKKHRAEQAMEFLQPLLNCRLVDSDRQYVINPQPSHFEKIQTLLQQHNLDKQRDILIGCHLGCHRVARRGWQFWRHQRHQHRKVWPLENYVALANKLKAANPRIQLLLTGSESESFLAKPFAKKAPWVTNLIGKTSLFEIAALMDQLALYITHDTGTLHIACARSVPLVALFGPTPVEFTGPYPIKPQHTIIRKMDMAEITVDEVYQAVMKHCNS